MLNARADWLVKLRISCAKYLRATQEKMASMFAEIIFYGVYYLTVLVYTKTTIHLGVGVASWAIDPWLGLRV